MSSVTFSTSVGGDGSTVTDDNNATTGLKEGGWKTRFVPALTQEVAVAAYVVNAALAILGGATTNSTSLTSLAIATGSKSLTLVESGKAYVIGQYVIIASTASPANSMAGQITSFSGTSLVVNVTTINGSGTIASWSISVSAAPATGVTSFNAGTTGLTPATAASGAVTLDGTLAVANGGTNLTAVGTSGNVLTSNGTTWESSTPVSSNGGATETSSAVSITLTAASDRVQAVNMTALNQSVILPNATSMSAGGPVFIIQNTGKMSFSINDNTGGVLAYVLPNQVQAVFMVNISSAAGTWSIGAFPIPNQVFAAGAVTAVNASSSSTCRVTALSETQAIVAWYADVDGGLRARTINVSVGGQLTFGAIFNPGIAINSTGLALTAMSATQALCAFSSASTCKAVTLNVSGTTTTAGIVATAGSTSGIDATATTMSATQAIISFVGTTNYPTAITANISGTSITFGTSLVPQSTDSRMTHVSSLSATQAVMSFTPSGAATDIRCCTLNVSGTTLTAGALLEVSGLVSDASKVRGMSKVSATQAMLVFPRTTTEFLSAATINVSGTTCTLGAILTVNTVVTDQISSTSGQAGQVLIVARTGSFNVVAPLTTFGTATTTAAAVTAINAVNGTATSVCRLSAIRSLTVFIESTFVQSQLLTSGVTI